MTQILQAQRDFAIAIAGQSLPDPSGEAPTDTDANEFLLKRFQGTEALGRPFHFEVDVFCKDRHIPFNSILGKSATVRLLTGDKVRFFNGIISRFILTDTVEDYAQYRAVIVPNLWLLTRNSDCRIFQNKTIPDIILEVLNLYGIDLDPRMRGSYKPWEYCVQYRETDFNFVSRLMEQEGIYYFFEHDDGKHKMVLADRETEPDELDSPYDKISYRPPSAAKSAGEYITDWSVEGEVQPLLVSLRDFDFKNPKNPVPGAALQPGYNSVTGGFEFFDYPGQYVTSPDGDEYAKVRLAALHSQFEVAHAHTSSRGITPGSIFELSDFPRPDQNQKYLITSAVYQLESDLFSSGPSNRSGPAFACSFSAMPTVDAANAPRGFSPLRVTPKPIIQGPQTAIIVGKSGEEIWTDEYGRVKVQFHWDRYSKADETSSCWIRVAQVWAGRNWGGMFIPRMGQEVIVEFLEGDPDRPIITGRVYNGDNATPYALPGDKTKSTVKSNSSKGGNSGNANEIRMEDKKGGEELYFHAEKDLNIRVKSARSEHVGASISTSAGGGISRSAGGDISRTSGANITDKATGTLTVNTGKAMSLKSGASYQLVTNAGIHFKTINFVMEAIEAGIASAMAALKGDAGAAVDAGKAAKGGDTSKANALADHVSSQLSSAFGPAVGAAHSELSRITSTAEKGAAKVGPEAQHAADAAKTLSEKVSEHATPEAMGEALVGFAVAAYEAYADAKKVLEGLLPQIPSIVMWAMKDIQGQALWGVSFSAKFRDVSLDAKTRDVHVKAKKNLNLT
ncbi:MAG: type VI secretion system tip protein TssI/VgrG, partial [Tepidisphaeraceae bacterium]